MISKEKLRQIIRIVNNRLTGKDADPVLIWLETVDACKALRVRDKHVQEIYETVASRLE